MEKCIACGTQPVVTMNGGVVCTKCRVTAPSETAWDAVMRKDARAPTPLAKFMTELEGPLIALNGIAAHSDDSGVRLLATSALLQINRLNVRAFFSNPADAEKVEKRLRRLVTETGVVDVKDPRERQKAGGGSEPEAG